MTVGPERVASGRSHGKTCVNKGARTYRTLLKHLELVLLTVGNQWKFLSVEQHH